MLDQQGYIRNLASTQKVCFLLLHSWGEGNEVIVIFQEVINWEWSDYQLAGKSSQHKWWRHQTYQVRICWFLLSSCPKYVFPHFNLRGLSLFICCSAQVRNTVGLIFFPFLEYLFHSQLPPITLVFLKTTSNVSIHTCCHYPTSYYIVLTQILQHYLKLFFCF